MENAGPPLHGQPQVLSSGIESIDPRPPELAEEDDDSFFVAPVPFRNDQLGWGLALWGAYLFRMDPKDTESPPSMVGAGGFFSENESWGAVAALKSYHDNDRFRLLLAGATGEVRYDFYGIGNDAGSEGSSLPFISTVDALYVEIQRAVAKGVFFGPTVSLANTQTDVDAGPAIPIRPDDDQLDATNLLIGVIAQNDTRDSQFYPTQGHLLTGRARFADDGFGSDFTFQRYGGAVQSYHPVSEKSVLAWRAIAEYSGGDAPFFALNPYPMRGVDTGRYLDRFMGGAEIEYRYKFSQRFGAVAFGGVGAVADRPSELDDSDPLATIGAGLRIQLTKKHPIHYRIDVAAGPDSVLFYLSLGEAF